MPCERETRFRPDHRHIGLLIMKLVRRHAVDTETKFMIDGGGGGGEGGEGGSSSRGWHA